MERQKNNVLWFVAAVLLLSWAVQTVIFMKLVPSSFTILYMYVPALLAFIFFFVDKAPFKKQIELFIKNPGIAGPVFAVLFPLFWFIVITFVAAAIGIGKINVPFLSNLTDAGFIVSYLTAIILFLPSGLGEEYGWRGYLLPALTEKWGRAWAAAAVGLVWAAWHIPSYFIIYSSVNLGNPILLTLLGMATVLVGSFPYAYCFYISKGNILPAVLLHAVYDVSIVMVFFGSPQLPGLTAGSPGILSVNWPLPLLFILITGSLFIPFFVYAFKKMK